MLGQEDKTLAAVSARASKRTCYNSVEVGDDLAKVALTPAERSTGDDLRLCLADHKFDNKPLVNFE